MHYVFPDTNILLHGKDLEEIEWAKWLGQKDITIVLTSVVIVELDKHKYNPNKRVSQKARKLLPRLESFIETPNKSKNKLLVLLKKPEDQTFNTYQLDKKEQDDVLLATILEFIKQLQTNETAILISNDTGPRLKAKSFSISANKLPDEFMLPDIPDESEKQIISLQKELQQLKNKVPIVSLCFEGDKTFLSVEKPSEIKSKSEFVNQNIQKLKEKYKPLVYREEEEQTFSELHKFHQNLFRLTVRQITQYNNKLEDFFKDYEKYLDSEYESNFYLINCTSVNIIAKNTGFVPATDLDIHLHFPNGFDVIKFEDVPKQKSEPEPPYKPSFAWDIGPRENLILKPPIISSSYVNSSFHKINTNVSIHSIKKTNSYDVEVHVKVIKHNQSVERDGLLLKFPDIRIAEGFKIDYKIMAGNISNVITGVLNVNFRKIE